MEQQIVLEPPLYFAPNSLHIWSTDFHPQQDVLAAPLINGHIQILKYSPDDVVPLVTVTDAHRSSCRHVRFNLSGNTLATCGEDKRLAFIDASGKVVHLIKKAHANPINRVHFANDSLLLSGDDDGLIKVWDLRNSECVFEAQEQTEAITGFYFDEEYTNILASSLDGTIAIYDIRQGFDSPHKLYAKSDSIDEELHGLEAMKHGKLIVCPSSQHSVLVYNRQNIQSFVDKIQEQPGSVQTIQKIDEDTFITGCQDGFVRGFSLRPNKLIRVIGQHEEDDHFPVQHIALSRCRNILASTSHDNSIKFYDISHFVRQRSQPRTNQQQEEYQEEPILKQEHHQKEEEEEDSYEEMEDSDEDEVDSTEEDRDKKGKKKKNYSLKSWETERKKETKRKFFEGL